MSARHERARTPAEERAFLVYYARVLLREAGARRHQFASRNTFYWDLLAWAAKARRDAAAIRLAPAQGDLFG
jgi:hypothetical protein